MKVAHVEPNGDIIIGGNIVSYNLKNISVYL